MYSITEIYERANLQHIREFLLHGVECCNIQKDNYKTRIKNAEKNYMKILLEHVPGFKEDTELYYELNNLLTEYENVYTEIGMQLGAMLAEELKNVDVNRM